MPALSRPRFLPFDCGYAPRNATCNANRPLLIIPSFEPSDLRLVFTALPGVLPRAARATSSSEWSAH
eukprot:1521792-Pyramimonas_sp.AAC.1